VTDETYERALRSAASQLEGYARENKLRTPEERFAALNDALQHAVGIILINERRPS
jgi:hypothetical protein